MDDTFGEFCLDMRSLESRKSTNFDFYEMNPLVGGTHYPVRVRVRVRVGLSATVRLVRVRVWRVLGLGL